MKEEIKKALECKKKYDAVKNYCLLSKENAKQCDEDWSKGWEKVKQAQDKVKSLLGSEYVDVIIFNRDELIKGCGW